MHVPPKYSFVPTPADGADSKVSYFVAALGTEPIEQRHRAGRKATVGSLFVAPVDAGRPDKLTKESETPNLGGWAHAAGPLVLHARRTPTWATIRMWRVLIEI
jgi:hypothetical protein